MQKLEQSAMVVVLIGCVIGVDCSQRWEDDVTATTSHVQIFEC
jgi:hypothetical protein